MRRHDLAPVSFDGGGHEGLAVGKHALACRVGVIIDNARRRVHELIVWAEVQVESLAKGGEGQSEGI